MISKGVKRCNEGDSSRVLSEFSKRELISSSDMEDMQAQKNFGDVLTRPINEFIASWFEDVRDDMKPEDSTIKGSAFKIDDDNSVAWR